MKVVILCGGKGTRLQEETEYRPKPMVPIGDQPILWHIMKYYAHFGHTDFILCLGYKGECIKSYFRNYLWNTCDVTLNLGTDSAVFYNSDQRERWTVTLAETGAESLTGYRVSKALDYINPGERFMLTYGDGLSNIDINKLISEHSASRCLLTVSAVHSHGRFGLLEICPSTSRIHRFAEKAQEPGYINGGFMVCESSTRDYVPRDQVMLEDGVIKCMVSGGQVNAYRHEDWWHPMDTVADMHHLNRYWREGTAPWKVW